MNPIMLSVPDVVMQDVFHKFHAVMRDWNTFVENLYTDTLGPLRCLSIVAQSSQKRERRTFPQFLQLPEVVIRDILHKLPSRDLWSMSQISTNFRVALVDSEVFERRVHITNGFTLNECAWGYIYFGKKKLKCRDSRHLIKRLKTASQYCYTEKFNVVVHPEESYHDLTATLEVLRENFKKIHLLRKRSDYDWTEEKQTKRYMVQQFLRHPQIVLVDLGFGECEWDTVCKVLMAWGESRNIQVVRENLPLVYGMHVMRKEINESGETIVYYGLKSAV